MPGRAYPGAGGIVSRRLRFDAQRRGMRELRLLYTPLRGAEPALQLSAPRSRFAPLRRAATPCRAALPTREARSRPTPTDRATTERKLRRLYHGAPHRRTP